VTSFLDGRRYELSLTRDLGERRAFDDHLELDVVSRGTATVRFVDARTARIEVPENTAIQARGEAPLGATG
jgi:hypothetical protein